MTAATTPDERWRLGYRPALDGLRAIAVLMVMGYHFGVPGLVGGGHTGVTIFFALSGFLITSLLLEERRERGHIDLLAFYGRRARRLLPALCALVAVVLVLAAGRRQLDDVAPQALAVLLYLGNWAQHGDPISLDHLSHTWSLGVEEQFYLVWPLVIVVAARARHTAAVVAAVAVIATVSLRFAGAELAALERSVDALMLGCLLAFATALGRVRVPGWAGYVGALLLAACMLVPYSGALGSWSLLVVGLATVALVGAIVADEPPRVARLLSVAPLVFIGRISYGLYLWHFAVGWELWPALSAAGWHWLPTALVLSMATFGLALLSWRYVETPALRWRRGSVRPPAMPLPAREGART